MNVFWIVLFAFLPLAESADGPLESIQVSGLGFERVPSHDRFLPWGFNYDRDDQGHLIEDYWESDWPRVEGDFREMKALGANVVRVHLQFGKFMKSATEPDEKALERLGKLLTLAETTGLYLDLTGLGCYHKADVPEWYDALTEEERWSAQARFWEAVASRGSGSPSVFCYDLMNEPVVPGGQRKPGDWLGPAFAGKHYVQVISLDQKGRPRPAGREGVDQDPRHGHPKARLPAPHHRRPGGLEPRPAGLDLWFRAVGSRPGPRLRMRPPLPGIRQGGPGPRNPQGVPGRQAGGD